MTRTGLSHLVWIAESRLYEPPRVHNVCTPAEDPLEASIESEEVSMRFSQELPKEPGVYWYRLTEEAAIRFCRVWKRAWDGKLIAQGADDAHILVERFGRWWSSSYLEEPEELVRSMARGRRKK